MTGDNGVGVCGAGVTPGLGVVGAVGTAVAVGDGLAGVSVVDESANVGVGAGAASITDPQAVVRATRQARAKAFVRRMSGIRLAMASPYGRRGHAGRANIHPC